MAHTYNTGYAIVNTDPNTISALQGTTHKIKLAISEDGNKIWRFVAANNPSSRWVELDLAEDIDNYDNYQSFNLRTGGIQRTTIQSGGILDFRSLNPAIAISYAAGGVVRFDLNADEINYNDLDGLPSIPVVQDWLRADVADIKTGGSLTLNDNIQLRFGTADSANGFVPTMLFSNGNATFLDIAQNESNFYIRDRGNSLRTLFSIQRSTGNINNGIGVGSTFTLFDDDNTRNNRIVLGADVNGGFIKTNFGSNGTRNLRFIPDGGNAAFGNIVPAERIDAVGNIRARGELQVGINYGKIYYDASSSGEINKGLVFRENLSAQRGFHFEHSDGTRVVSINSLSNQAGLLVNKSSNDEYSQIINNAGGSGKGLQLNIGGTASTSMPLQVNRFNGDLLLQVNGVGETKSTSFLIDTQLTTAGSFKKRTSFTNGGWARNIVEYENVGAAGTNFNLGMLGSNSNYTRAFIGFGTWNGSDAFYMTPDHKYGFNTTVPYSTVEISQGFLSIGSSSGSGNLGIELGNLLVGSSMPSQVRGVIGTMNSSLGISAGSIGYQPRTGVNASHIWFTETIERMRLASTGNLGLGTTLTETDQRLNVYQNDASKLVARFAQESNGAKAIIRLQTKNSSGTLWYSDIQLDGQTGNLQLRNPHNSSSTFDLTRGGNIVLGLPNALAITSTSITTKMHIANTTSSGVVEVARFQGGLDADNNSAIVRINQTSDRGLFLQGGRAVGDKAFGIIGLTSSSGSRTDILTLNNDQSIDCSNTVTASNFILNSDKKLKTNIKNLIPTHIDISWKSFEFIKNPNDYRVGVIAQDLEKKHPEFIRTDNKGTKSVAYIDLLIAKIAELENRLIKLEK